MGWAWPESISTQQPREKSQSRTCRKKYTSVTNEVGLFCVVIRTNLLSCLRWLSLILIHQGESYNRTANQSDPHQSAASHPPGNTVGDITRQCIIQSE